MANQLSVEQETRWERDRVARERDLREHEAAAKADWSGVYEGYYEEDD